MEAVLVTREQRGKWAYYRVVPAALLALGETLCAPAAQARRARREATRDSRQCAADESLPGWRCSPEDVDFGQVEGSGPGPSRAHLARGLDVSRSVR